MNHPTTLQVNFDVIASRIESASPHAAYFLRLQAVRRKVGVRMTSIRTVFDKLNAGNATVTRNQAGRILSVFSELGLGTEMRHYNLPAIRWNSQLNVIAIGLHLERRARQRQALSDMPSVAKGRMLVCMMPSGSYEALVATGQAAQLEVELFTNAEDVGTSRKSGA